MVPEGLSFRLVAQKPRAQIFGMVEAAGCAAVFDIKRPDFRMHTDKQGKPFTDPARGNSNRLTGNVLIMGNSGDVIVPDAGQAGPFP